MASYIDVAHAAAELTVTVGIIEASMNTGEGQWPEPIKDNFEEKVAALIEHLEQEMREFIDFGQALDASEDL